MVTVGEQKGHAEVPQLCRKKEIGMSGAGRAGHLAGPVLAGQSTAEHLLLRQWASACSARREQVGIGGTSAGSVKVRPPTWACACRAKHSRGAAVEEVGRRLQGQREALCEGLE